MRCPRCGSDDVAYLPNARVFKCYQKHERQKFSLKVGTVFEDSAIGLEKWLPALWLLTTCKNGISSYELARAFNDFYTQCPVLQSEEPTRSFRLRLVAATRQALASSLALLGITAPQAM